MKTIFLLIIAIATLFLSPFKAQAQFTAPSPPTPALTSFGLGDRVISTNIHYAIISANGRGVARVQYLNASSDKGTATIKFYSVTNFVTVTNAGASAVTNVVLVNNPSGMFTNSAVLILQHVTNDFYERLVWSADTTTNLTFTSTTAGIPSVGDKIYLVGIQSTIPVFGGGSGATLTNKEINAGGGAIYNGQLGRPVLVEIDNVTNGVMGAVSGIYQP